MRSAHETDGGAVRAVIALGSNLGDRRSHMIAGMDGLAGLESVTVLTASKLYETAPVGGPDAQGPYLNAAALVETRLAAARLLAALHEIEARRERVRELRWGPRTLDLDLLIYGDAQSADPALMLPHPRMHERRFAMAPAADVAPEMVHPVLGRSLASIAAALPAEQDDLAVVEPVWWRAPASSEDGA